MCAKFKVQNGLGGVQDFSWRGCEGWVGGKAPKMCDPRAAEMCEGCPTRREQQRKRANFHPSANWYGSFHPIGVSPCWVEAEKSAAIRFVFGPHASPGLGASFRTRIPTASERGHKIAWVVFSSGFGAVVGLVEFGVTTTVTTSRKIPHLIHHQTPYP